MTTNAKINIKGTGIAICQRKDERCTSFTDTLKANNRKFIMSDWLRARRTIEFPGIWNAVHIPNFNSGEFAIIKSQPGLKTYKPTQQRISKCIERHLHQLSQLNAKLRLAQLQSWIEHHLYSRKTQLFFSGTVKIRQKHEFSVWTVRIFNPALTFGLVSIILSHK